MENAGMTNEPDDERLLKEVKMKKGIILTLSMLLAAVLLTAGLYGYE